MAYSTTNQRSATGADGGAGESVGRARTAEAASHRNQGECSGESDNGGSRGTLRIHLHKKPRKCVHYGIRTRWEFGCTRIYLELRALDLLLKRFFPAIRSDYTFAEDQFDESA
jgi:hypothetical protein